MSDHPDNQPFTPDELAAFEGKRFTATQTHEVEGATIHEADYGELDEASPEAVSVFWNRYGVTSTYDRAQLTACIDVQPEREAHQEEMAHAARAMQAERVSWYRAALGDRVNEARQTFQQRSSKERER